MAWLLGLAAVGAAAAGAVGNILDSSSTSNKSEIILDEAGARELFGFDLQEDQLRALQDIFSMGPGKEDYAAATGAQRSFADMLGEYARSGGMPTEGDIGAARGFAGDMFAPEYTSFQQELDNARMMTQRTSAQMGRAGNDPILQAKLAQEAARGRERIGSRETAFAAQFAQGLPDRRLGYAGQRVDVLSGLGNQAVQNKLQLMGWGQQLGTQERNWRLSTADKVNVQSTGGGGFGSAFTGAIGGAGAGLDLYSGFKEIQGRNKLNNWGSESYQRAKRGISEPTDFGSPGQYGGSGSGSRYNLGGR